MIQSYDQYKFSAETIRAVGFALLIPFCTQVLNLILTGLKFDVSLFYGGLLSVPFAIVGLKFVSRAREIMEERDARINRDILE